MPGKKRIKTATGSNRYPFIAEHRGGPLTKENHRQLIRWARECAAHVLPLVHQKIDGRLIHALDVAKKWEKGKASTGMAMKASSGAHKAARQIKDPVYKAVARAIGQAAATAHMADHSPGGAYYALKAIKLAGKKVNTERNWQIGKLSKLSGSLMKIVQAMWKEKELERRL